jgi:hypothetical protein
VKLAMGGDPTKTGLSNASRNKLHPDLVFFRKSRFGLSQKILIFKFNLKTKKTLKHQNHFIFKYLFAIFSNS